MRWPRRKPKPPKREAIYPVHGHSLGYCGTPREPFTFFRCEVCGSTTIGSPYEPPERMCLPPMNADGSIDWHDAVWTPMDQSGALARLHAIETPEIVARTQS